MTINEGELVELLERYRVAMYAHQQALSALIDAMLNYDAPKPDLAAAERRTQKELVMARKELLRALANR